MTEHQDGPETEVSGPFRGGKVHVLAGKCSTCVFRAGNRMHLAEGRLKDLIDSNVENDSALTCHKTLDEWPGTAPPAVCRGFFDGYKTTPLQIAERLGMIVMDPVPE
jgi:hypothetical protein